MEKHAAYLVLAMCTHFYIIPSTSSQFNTTVTLTSTKSSTTTKPPVPTTTSSSASLTTESQTSTSSKASNSTKSVPIESIASDITTQSPKLLTTVQYNTKDNVFTEGDLEASDEGTTSKPLPPQNLNDSNTQNSNGIATSPTNELNSDIMDSSTDTITGETTEDMHTTPTILSMTSEPAMSSNKEASTSENSKNDTVSHTTSGMTSTERETPAEKTSSTDKAATGVTKASSQIIDSMFGSTGLPIIIGLVAICIFLLIIIIIMIIRASKKRHSHSVGGEESMPKLKMLEIKDDKAKRSNNDNLQTFSLDYEKHVQEKIDEHKKKNQTPPKAEKSKAGVSTFTQKKKQSLRSNQSVSSYSSAASPLSPVSPSSPSSPAETKPLIKQHEDEPFVFNFAKRPSELLTTRHTSAFDEAGRRRSNVSGGRTSKLTASDELFDI